MIFFICVSIVAYLLLVPFLQFYVIFAIYMSFAMTEFVKSTQCHLLLYRYNI